MATNQTNIHKKIDKIMEKLETLGTDSKAIAQQTRYLAQLVVLAKQDSARQHQESQALAERQHHDSQAMARDMAQILLEVKKSSDDTAKTVAEILGASRKH